jgi:hypothetical protein
LRALHKQQHRYSIVEESISLILPPLSGIVLQGEHSCSSLSGDNAEECGNWRLRGLLTSRQEASVQAITRLIPLSLQICVALLLPEVEAKRLDLSAAAEGERICCMSFDVASEEEVAELLSLPIRPLGPPEAGRWVVAYSDEGFLSVLGKGYHPELTCYVMAEEFVFDEDVYRMYLTPRNTRRAARPSLLRVRKKTEDGSNRTMFLDDNLTVTAEIPETGVTVVSKNGQYVGMLTRHSHTSGTWEIFDSSGRRTVRHDIPLEYDEGPIMIAISNNGNWVKIDDSIGLVLSFYSCEGHLLNEVGVCEEEVGLALSDFSEDGKYFAVTYASRYRGRGKIEGLLFTSDGLKLWDLTFHKSLGGPHYCTVSPRGSYVVAAFRSGGDGALTCLVDREGSVTANFGGFGTVRASFSSSEDRAVLLSKGRKGGILLVDTGSGEILFKESVMSPRDDVSCAELGGVTGVLGGSLLEVLDPQGQRIWRASLGANAFRASFSRISISEDGTEILVAGGDLFRVYKLDE